MLLTAARPPASGELSASCTSPCAPWPGPPEGPTAATLCGARGRTPGFSVGGCVSDFALAPLRGLDVQTSPERAKREGPARGRRQREAPQLKGAGRAPLLGRTRGRKEGAGAAGPGLGMRAASGWAARELGVRFGPPRHGQPGRGRGQLGAPASVLVLRGIRRQGTLRRGGGPLAAVPSPEGPRESKAKASPCRGLRARGGGWPGRRQAGGLGGRGALSARPTRPAGRARRRNSPAPP